MLITNLFYHTGNRLVYLVGMWDCVSFDVATGFKFKYKGRVQIMKNYITSDSSVSSKEAIQQTYCIRAQHKSECGLSAEDFTSVWIVPSCHDWQLFLARIHFFIPDWEITKLHTQYFTDSYGLIFDYFAKFMWEMRKVPKRMLLIP